MNRIARNVNDGGHHDLRRAVNVTNTRKAKKTRKKRLKSKKKRKTIEKMYPLIPYSGEKFVALK